MSFTLHEQIAAVAREIALRERNYPKWVAQGRMRSELADYQIAVMKEVLHTLSDKDKPQLFSEESQQE